MNGSLFLTVLRADRLKTVQLVGKQSPYAQFQLVDASGEAFGVHARTKAAVNGGKSPEWTSGNRLELPFEFLYDTSWLAIEVLATDPKTGVEKVIGVGLLDWSRTLADAQASPDGRSAAVTAEVELNDISTLKPYGAVLYLALHCEITKPKVTPSVPEPVPAPAPAPAVTERPNVPTFQEILRDAEVVEPPLARGGAAASGAVARTDPHASVAAVGQSKGVDLNKFKSNKASKLQKQVRKSANEHTAPVVDSPPAPAPSAPVDTTTPKPKSPKPPKRPPPRPTSPEAPVVVPPRVKPPRLPSPPKSPPPLSPVGSPPTLPLSENEDDQYSDQVEQAWVDATRNAMSVVEMFACKGTSPATLLFMLRYFPWCIDSGDGTAGVDIGFAQHQGVLNIRVLRGENLRSRQLLGKQNPFVQLTMQDVRGEILSSATSITVFSGGTNPVWPPEDIGVDLAYHAPVHEKLVVVAEVWHDEGNNSHKRIGVGSVDITRASLSEGELFVVLSDSTGKKSCGILVLQAGRSVKYLEALLAEAVKGVWLGHRARQRVKRVPLCMAKLQSYWRMRQQRDTYRRIRDAAVAIQAEVRCFLGRQWFEVARAAAVALQSAFRRKQAQREYAAVKASAVLLQSQLRGFSKRSEYAKMRVAAQLFQAAFRRRKARRQYNEAKQSAVLLQSHMRGHLQRKRYQQERAAAVLFQTAYRGLKAKRFLALQRRLMLKRRLAATTIQKFWRGYKARLRFRSMMKAVLLLQSGWRGLSGRLHVCRMKLAAMLMQAAWRGCACRRELTAVGFAATKIESAWRGFTARLQSDVAVFAATIIQSVWRMHAVRRVFRVFERACARIQASWRGHKTRQDVTVMHSAVTKIGSTWRARHHKAQFREMKGAAARIQQVWRRHKARRDHQFTRFAAQFVQAAWRGFVARRDVLGEFTVSVRELTGFPTSLLHKPSPCVVLELEDGEGLTLCEGTSGTVVKCPGKTAVWTEHVLHHRDIKLSYRVKSSVALTLVVTVWDKDVSGSRADAFIGTAKLDMRPYVLRKGGGNGSTVTIPLLDMRFIAEKAKLTVHIKSRRLPHQLIPSSPSRPAVPHAFPSKSGHVPPPPPPVRRLHSSSSLNNSTPLVTTLDRKKSVSFATGGVPSANASFAPIGSETNVDGLDKYHRELVERAVERQRRRSVQVITALQKFASPNTGSPKSPSGQLSPSSSSEKDSPLSPRRNSKEITPDKGGGKAVARPGFAAPSIAAQGREDLARLARGRVKPPSSPLTSLAKRRSTVTEPVKVSATVRGWGVTMIADACFAVDKRIPHAKTAALSRFAILRQWFEVHVRHMDVLLSHLNELPASGTRSKRDAAVLVRRAVLKTFLRHELVRRERLHRIASTVLPSQQRPNRNISESILAAVNGSQESLEVQARASEVVSPRRQQRVENMKRRPKPAPVRQNPVAYEPQIWRGIAPDKSKLILSTSLPVKDLVKPARKPAPTPKKPTVTVLGVKSPLSPKRTLVSTAGR